MLTLQVALQCVMLTLWFMAASSAGAAMSLRWVALAIAIPVAFAARLSPSRGTRLPVVSWAVAGLGLYGTFLATISRVPSLAISKCLTFTATTLVFLAGGSALVERFGRDRVLSIWRTLWRLLLLFSIASVLFGHWRSGPEGLYGPTGNPNMYGSILLTVGLILAIPVLEESLALRLAETAVGVALLVATRSRTALVAALMAGALALVLRGGRGRWLWASTILVVSAALLIFRPEQAVQDVTSVTEGTTLREMASTRLTTWEDSWVAMKAGLPWGLGWGVKAGKMPVWSFDVKTLGYGREEGTSWLPIGEELGIPGFALFAWLWFLLARAVSPSPVRVRVLAGAVVVGYFAMATFEGWLLSPGNWETAAFWTTLGIVFTRPMVEGMPLVPAGSSSTPRGTAE